MPQDRPQRRPPAARGARQAGTGRRPPGGAARRTSSTATPRRDAPARPASAREVLEEIRRVARPGQGPAAVKAFEDGVSLLERGRDAAAVRSALEAKALAPRSGAVRELLGLALYRAGRFQEALRELQAYRRITGRVD